MREARGLQRKEKIGIEQRSSAGAPRYILEVGDGEFLRKSSDEKLKRAGILVELDSGDGEPEEEFLALNP